jgi:hypothetical protein
MTTKLNKQLKREIEVDGKPYMITLTPEGVKLTEKGKRLGREHTWKGLLGAGGGGSGSGASGGAAGGSFGPAG